MFKDNKKKNDRFLYWELKKKAIKMYFPLPSLFPLSIKIQNLLLFLLKCKYLFMTIYILYAHFVSDYCKTENSSCYYKKMIQ